MNLGRCRLLLYSQLLNKYLVTYYLLTILYLYIYTSLLVGLNNDNKTKEQSIKNSVRMRNTKWMFMSLQLYCKFLKDKNH